MLTVSVIVPAYNQAHYLGEAIGSALAQTHADIELLVVDDGSTDDTRAVAAGFTDARLRYVYQNNRGLSAARNTGIRQARGTFLTFLDSDDRFLPDKLAVLLAAFKQNPDLGLVAGQAVLIGANGQPLGEVFDRGLPSDSADLLLGNPLHVGSVLLRRDWLQQVGAFDEALRSYEDWDLWLRLARAGCPMASVPHPVSLYRFHGAQMTRSGSQMTRASFAVLDKTFAIPGLPEPWLGKRDKAYSRAMLRAAAQAYAAADFPAARQFMADAIRLDPALCEDNAEPLARVAAGWANHAKTAEPLEFLASVYEHLPEELAVLGRRRRPELARQAVHLASAARQRGDMATTRSRIRQAATYRPQVLCDRRVLSMLLSRDRTGAPVQ